MTSTTSPYPTLMLGLLSLLIAAFTAGINDVDAQDPTQEQTSIEKRIAPLVTSHLEKGMFQGLSIGIVKGENVSFLNYGTTGHAQAKPSRTTIYEIGSISKVFTGTLLADAVLKKRSTLDQSLGSLIPELVEANPEVAAIKLKQLSTHTSGLPRMPYNMPGLLTNDPFKEYSRQNLHDYLKKANLRTDPGTKHDYSNLAVGLLGDLLAQSTEQTYEALLKNTIAGPLKMESTTLTVSEDSLPRFALPTSRVREIRSAFRWNFDALAGAGAIRSTTEDMVKFIQAVIEPPDSQVGKALKLAFDLQIEKSDGVRPMGLGWILFRDGQTRWHNGRTGGYQSMMMVNRGEKLGVVLLSNTSGSDLDRLGVEIFQTLRKSPAP